MLQFLLNWKVYQSEVKSIQIRSQFYTAHTMRSSRLLELIRGYDFMWWIILLSALYAFQACHIYAMALQTFAGIGAPVCY